MSTPAWDLLGKSTTHTHTHTHTYTHTHTHTHTHLSMHIDNNDNKSFLLSVCRLVAFSVRVSACLFVCASLLHLPICDRQRIAWRSPRRRRGRRRTVQAWFRRSWSRRGWCVYYFHVCVCACELPAVCEQKRQQQQKPENFNVCAICIYVWEPQVLANLPILIRYLLFCVQEASRLQKQKLADLDWTPWDTHIDPSLQNRTEFFAEESHKQNQAAISFEESVQSKS